VYLTIPPSLNKKQLLGLLQGKGTMITLNTYSKHFFIHRRSHLITHSNLKLVISYAYNSIPTVFWDTWLTNNKIETITIEKCVPMTTSLSPVIKQTKLITFLFLSFKNLILTSTLAKLIFSTV
jgi:hypothetical protein